MPSNPRAKLTHVLRVFALNHEELVVPARDRKGELPVEIVLGILRRRLFQQCLAKRLPPSLLFLTSLWLTNKPRRDTSSALIRLCKLALCALTATSTVLCNRIVLSHPPEFATNGCCLWQLDNPLWCYTHMVSPT